MIFPANSPFVIAPLAPASADVPLGLVGASFDTSALPDINGQFEPASIVSLSAQAQLLAASASIAAAVAQNNDLLASQERIVQLSTAASLALLNEDINAAQYATLIDTETSAAGTALQNALADTTLSNAAALANQNVDAAQYVDLITTEISATNTALQGALADAALSDAVAQTAVPVATIPTAAEANAVAMASNSFIPNVALPMLATNPDILATDPAIAAAIAAYHVGDGLFATPGNRPAETPPESNNEVTPVSAVKASALDLHDSERDDAINGIAWNWMRINPIHRRFTRR